MKNIKRILLAGAMSVVAVVMIAAPTFAACDVSSQTKYPNLKFGGGSDSEYPVHCPGSVQIEGTSYQVYAKSQSACTQAGVATISSDICDDSKDFGSIVNTIINWATYIIGIVAVIMIILGGVHYATSQGDPAKVKKGKDTILYGIIGLIIAIMAYAIINFVLNSLIG